MKTENISTLLALVISAIILTPVYADSNQSKKEQRYEQRRGAGEKSTRQKQTNRHQQKSSRGSDKNLHPGQRKQDLKDHRKQEKYDKRQDRRYSTHRRDDRDYNRYNKHPRSEKHQRNYRTERYSDRYYDSRDHRRDNRRYELRHGKRLLKLTPRHRIFRNIVIVRPFGHSYFGYGHYLNDRNAWKWLGFTAITLKLLDMVNEQAQREHEAAQIEATTADIGERIYWDTEDASGYVVTTREGSSSHGLPCREYQQSITIGGQTEEAYGSACLQQDGAWKIVD